MAISLEGREALLRRTEGARSLEKALRAKLRGEVRFDAGSRALYSTAASNYRQVPLGVVIPRDVEDVVSTVELCREYQVPLVSRGGGTGLAGQTTNRGVVMDFSKYVNRLVSLDAEARRAVVEPGLILDQLRAEAERSQLTFGPDPATHSRCTLGGMIGNNSCGVHSVMAGTTAQNVESLEVLTSTGLRLHVKGLDDEVVGDGRELIARVRAFRDRHEDAIRKGFPNIPRRVSGYDLPALLPENGASLAQALVGSEGTLVTVLRATVKLVHSPPKRTLVALGYPSVFEAADHVTEVLEAGPIGLEGLDEVLVEGMKKKHLHPQDLQLLPEGRGWLLAEFGGDTQDEAEERAHALARLLEKKRDRPNVKLLSAEEAQHVWRVRESGLGATARVPGEADTWEGWEDAAVPPAQLGAYLRQFKAQLERYHFHAALYGHFGQGCVHTRIPFDLRSTAGVATFRSFVEEAADLVVRHGGSLSGEHGDGQSRAELLPKMFSPELIAAFEEFKAIWDPIDLLNPNKVVRPYRLDENLRLGPSYQRPTLKTHFQFPDEQAGFASATERCVGVGECRRLEGGTMCPSFMVTREEAHSTRGRAHLLFETMRGGVPDGWKSDAVKDALDLCLSCKGCKGDCPVNVDVATYKAEFLSHYYEGRLRPRTAYVFGLVYWWARLGSLAPRLINWVMRRPLLGKALKRLAGIAAEREFPQLASFTFTDWWRARVPKESHGRPVLLWVDTFNNHWEPDVLIAAVHVLESAGLEVRIAPGSLCCGRPLYDYGMLDVARGLLVDVLEQLRPAIRAGVPIVGVEPSCVSVFRDELLNFFPHDEDAKALAKQTFMLDEYLQKEQGNWVAPRLERRALVQGHCHEKAVLHGPHVELLEKIGVKAEVLDSGCCGMAGGFGYEREHHGVSVACGERSLLPSVRKAPEDALVIADGFSCRQQIRQLTPRNALSMAQVLELSLQQRQSLAERESYELQGPRRRRAAWPVAIGVAAISLGAWFLRRRRR